MKKHFIPLTALSLLALVSCGGNNNSSHATGLTSESSHATGLTSESSHATGLTSESSHATGLTSESESHATGLTSEDSSEEVSSPYSLIGKFDDANWDTDIAIPFDEDEELYSIAKHFKAGDEFKIRQDKAWDVSYGFPILDRYDVDWSYDCIGEGKENGNIAVLADCTLYIDFDPSGSSPSMDIITVPDETPTDWCKGFKDFWEQKFQYIPPFIYFGPLTVRIENDDWQKYRAGAIIRDGDSENIFEKYGYAATLEKDGWNKVEIGGATFASYEATKTMTTGDECGYFCSFGVEDGFNTLYFYASHI